MKIQESAENYLETILIIGNRKPQVRSIDIANELNFSKPSVSVAMKNLRLNGYIQMDHDGFITLTPSGKAIADKIYERHRLLSSWLEQLGVDPKVAAEDACRMEHVIAQKALRLLSVTPVSWRKSSRLQKRIPNFQKSRCVKS